MKKTSIKNGVSFYRLRGQKQSNNYSVSISQSRNWQNVLKLATNALESGKWDKIIVEQVKTIKIFDKEEHA